MISFDISTPRDLERKVWVDIMLYLIRRGRENVRQMTNSTFEIKVDASDKRFVTQTLDEMVKYHRENCDRNATIDEGCMNTIIRTVVLLKVSKSTFQNFILTLKTFGKDREKALYMLTKLYFRALLGEKRWEI